MKKLLTFTIGLLLTLGLSGQIRSGVVAISPASGGSSTLLTGLVGYWNLNESTGNALSSVGGLDGTPAGGVTQGSTTLNVGLGTCYTFNGSTGLTNHGHHTEFELQAFTISAWVNCNDNYVAIVTNWNAASGFRFQYDGGALNFQTFRSTGGDATITGSSSIINAWHFVVATFSGTTLNIYVDNVSAAAEVSWAQTIDYGTSNFEIGGDAVGANWANGKIDEVGFWGRVLTSGEMTTLYNSGSGKTYPFN